MDLNPANPMSPLSPVHPLNTETEVVAPLPHKVPSFDWTINWLTIVLLVIGALIFAGWWWSRWRDSRRARREWTALKGEIVIRKTRQEKFKPECQSCSSFISCAMAGVSKCPLIEKMMDELHKLPTLESLRATIKRNARLVGKAPYSHNIIGITLRMIDEHHGRVEANKAIDDFKLRRKGWEYQPCDHCGHWPCGCGG